jgi:hypothetical protein
MKKIYILLLLVATFSLANAQTGTQYRSKGTGVSVDLSSNANWDISTDNGATFTDAAGASAAAPATLTSGATILILATDRWQNLSATVATVAAGVTLTNKSSVVPIAADFAAGKLDILGTLIYSGTTAQTMPFLQSFKSSTIAGDLTINNSAGVSQGTSGTGSTFFTINGVLNLQSGQYTCNTGSSNFTLKGSIVAGGGILSLPSFFTLQGSAAQTLPASIYTGGSTGYLNVNNAAGVNTTGNLIISNYFKLSAGTLTLGGSLSLKAVSSRLVYTAGGIDAGNNTVSFDLSTQQAVPADGFFINNTINKLAITNTAGVTYPANLTIGSSLTTVLKTAVTPLAVTGTSTITGSSLTISSFDTPPATGDVFTVLTGSTAVTGVFTSLTLPAGYTGTLAYTATDVKLTLATVLPVGLTSFTGKKAYNGVELKWQTASELNNNYFEVLRSENGKDFTSIGTIKGNGTSQEIRNYNFTDVNPVSGANYYQLKQTDFDGTAKIVGETVAVTFGNNLPEFNVSSNGNTLKVFVFANNAGLNNLVITDMQGKKVAQDSRILAKGYNTFSINVGSLNAGVFVAQSSNADGIKVTKFIKD